MDNKTYPPEGACSGYMEEIETYLADLESEDEDKREAAIGRLNEIPLSFSVRDGWRGPFDAVAEDRVARLRPAGQPGRGVPDVPPVRASGGGVADGLGAGAAAGSAAAGGAGGWGSAAALPGQHGTPVADRPHGRHH